MSFKMKRTLEMRRVESAFADYLENEDSIDLLWSDKVGYVFLTMQSIKSARQWGNTDGSI